MNRAWRQRISLFVIWLLSIQTVFGSIPVLANIDETLQVTIITENAPYTEGTIATSLVTIQVTTTTADSANIQVELSKNEGNTWAAFDMSAPLILTEEGDHSIWFRIIGQSAISKHRISIAVPQPSLLAMGNIIYVKEGAKGDGTSWAKALGSLQAALDKAQSGQQIWLAAGTYKPTTKINKSDNRTATFQLKKGIVIYGGFNGTETTITARNWKANPTILSGDIGTKDNDTDNAYHVFYHPASLQLDQSTILDGVTIENGNANGSDSNGGGMYNERSSPTLSNVIISSNQSEYGGGMYNDNSNPMLTNVTFSSNKAKYGSGMYNNSGSPTLTNVTFNSNTAKYTGGGMYNNNSSPKLETVTFSDNTTTDRAGGMYNYQGTPMLTDVEFINNTATYYGGGMYNSMSSPKLETVTFARNSVTDVQADSGGGGIYNDNSVPILSDVAFSDNKAKQGAGMYNSSSNLTLTDASFSGNIATNDGGGMYNTDSNPVLTNITFSQNTAKYGGGMANNNSSPSLKNDITFRDNQALYGGGMTNASNSHPSLIDVEFIDNKADYGGGGMYNNNNSNPKLINVAFSLNSAINYGGGMYNSNSSPTLINTLFNNNEATHFGGGVYNHNSSLTLTNVTISGNRGAIFGGTSQSKIVNSIIVGNENKPALIDYAGAIENSLLDVEESSGIVAKFHQSKMEIKPEPYTFGDIFIDPSKRDYQLKVNSPAINKGNNAHNNQPTDLAGKTRFQKGIIDLGAYEAGFYQVTYQPNGATGGSVPKDTKFYEEKDSVIVKSNSGNLMRTGYTFAGWNMKPDGTGKEYVENSTFQITDDIELYAKWTKNPTYTVKYYGNDNTGGSVPTDSKEYEEKSIVTVKNNSGNLVKTGHTFAGWNTQADGEGINYAENATFQIGKVNIALYAKWAKNPTYTITYDGNGKTSGDVPKDTMEYGEKAAVTVKNNSGNLVKTGYTFAGWNTQADGKGINYAENATFQMGKANMTLYAEWIKNPKYTVTYDGNGAIDGDVPKDMVEYEEKAAVTVKNNSGNLVKTGHTFAGWNTQADGKGMHYEEKAMFSMGKAHVTLYAEWLATSYLVTFESNGGSKIAEQSIEYNTQASNPNSPNKQGYTFVGWYKDKELTKEWNFKIDVVKAETTLYAKWTTNPTYTVTYHANGATSGTVPQDSRSYEEEQTVTVQGNDGKLARAGYTFKGWNTQADGKGISYAEKAMFQMGTMNVSLYVEWLVNPPATGGNTPSPSSNDTPPTSNDNDASPPASVKIILHTNGGTILKPISITANTKVSDLPVPTREGYQFEGWYQDEALTKQWDKEAIVKENLPLYSKWIALPVEAQETPQESPQESQQSTTSQSKPTIVTLQDVEHHWARDMVEALTAQGIIQGFEDGTFRPNAPISRMHVAVLLTRAFSLEAVRATNDFSDVPSTHPYYEAIQVLQQAGVIDGTDGAFRPTENMTRAQLAKVLVGVLGLTPEGTSSFADVDSTHWSTGYIAVLEREGIALGDNGNFRPNEPVTRAQFVAFLYRIVQTER